MKKQTLGEAINEIGGVHPDWKPLECFKKGFKEGVIWQKKQSLWISVKDRLPQTGDDLYIVLNAKMNPPGCGVCDFNPKTSAWIDCNYNIVYPTHWMPIPLLESNGNGLERKE